MSKNLNIYLKAKNYDLELFNKEPISNRYISLNPSEVDIKNSSIIELKNTINKNNAINVLISSQGYSLDELYDDEKVKSSKFLSSLKKELDTDIFLFDLDICFSYDNPLGEEVEMTDSFFKLLPTENLKVGFSNGIKHTDMGIVLEKEAIFNRKNLKLDKDISYLTKESYENINEVKVNEINYQKLYKNLISIYNERQKLEVDKRVDEEFEF